MGPWLESYLAERTDMKPGSKAALELTKEKLVDYFTGAKALRSITANEASQWRASIAATRLAPATVKHHVGNAKGMFAEAERRGPVSANPFAHLKSGATAAANERYIAPAEADAIVTALPTAEFKLLFGLARFAGLRCPSETHLLTWADVDFERARLNVRSPKTEHHAGHERRTVPIVPKLMKLLQEAFAAEPEGEARLVRTYGGFTRRTLEK